jgi:hypothetical protein
VTRDAIDGFLARELGSAQRAWKQGNERGLRQALLLCERFHRPLPRWATAGLLSLLDGEKAVKNWTGRHARAATASAEDMKHFTRWDAVREMRDRQPELASIASTWDATYAAVAELLEGSEAAGTEETIARSYKLVQREMRAGRGGRFYLG